VLGEDHLNQSLAIYLPITLLCDGVYSSDLISEPGHKLDPDLLLVQDLDPNHFTRDLIAVAYTQVIIQVLLSVEPNRATVVIAAPVLRVDTNQHQIDPQNRSRCSFVRPIRLS
jgi:hypothetical protein